MNDDNDDGNAVGDDDNDGGADDQPQLMQF